MEKNVKAELLVVDDHSLILEGICKIVNKMPEVTVADAVTSGKQAIKLIEERDYDVYILDISIPDISGFELIAKIRELNDQARIVVNTMHEEIWMVNRLVQCGVNAVILKSSAHAELVAAIRSVLRGESYTCPRFASILQKLNSSSSSVQPKNAPTRRERDVLEAEIYVFAYCSKQLYYYFNKKSRVLLKISENTVETFRKRLISKFGAKNAIDMVVKAVSQGWIKLD